MKLFYMTVLLFSFCACNAQPAKVIQLNAPSKDRGHSVMKALELRQSSRELANKALNQQDLSDLVWAANGINRKESGKRTAPSAMNKQDVDVYVCLPEGAYRYDAQAHVLNLVVAEDLRPALAESQEFAKTAPVIILLVSDTSKFQGEEQQKTLQGAADAGIVSQNISLFCAGTDLLTVPRMYMNREKVSSILKLGVGQIPVINHPVGYPSK